MRSIQRRISSATGDDADQAFSYDAAVDARGC